MRPILPITDSKSRWDHYSAAPLIRDGSVYVGSRDGCVHALSLESGAKVRDYCSSDEITARPVIDGGKIYYASFDGNVYAARLSDGQMLWKHETYGALTRDLVLAGNRIVAGSRSYDLMAIDKRSGHRLWTHYDWWSWIDSVPEIHGDELLIGSSDSQRVYRLNTVNGRTVWATFIGGWAWPRPSLGKTVVYAGFVGTTMPYVGKRIGGLAALDARTGRIKWMINSKPRADSPIYGFAAAPLVALGKVYVADLDGTVFAFPAK